MVHAGCMSMVLLVCVLLNPATSLPNSDIVDLTRELIRVSLGSVNKSLNFCRRESLWMKNKNTFGCICDLKYCMPLCCPVTHSASTDGCVLDSLTNRADLGFEPDDKDPQFSFVIPRNDTLKHEEFFDEELQSRDYCLFRHPNSTKFNVLVCEGQPVRESYGTEDVWVPAICFIVSVVFKIATFIVYSVLPELNRSLQGWTILSFLASDVCNMSLIVLDLVLLSKTCLTKNLYIAIGFVANFCSFAQMMWLNVISFDIWKKFRTIQSVRSANIERRKRKAYFVRYSIYVWSTSVVYATIVLYWFDLKMTSYDDSTWNLLYLFGVPGAIVFICNTSFYTMTALKIKRWKKETSDMVDGVNKHHRENQKWFNLDLKLFVMTGCPMILWAVSYLWDNKIFKFFVHVTEALQGLFIFLIFVWKTDVMGSIRVMFNRQ